MQWQRDILVQYWLLLVPAQAAYDVPITRDHLLFELQRVVVGNVRLVQHTQNHQMHKTVIDNSHVAKSPSDFARVACGSCASARCAVHDNVSIRRGHPVCSCKILVKQQTQK